jgi:preprotein translocase subunit Sec63|tara:strand:+ start:153 stop:359 length:207 start_codon:yes stop_codon:yes gene_type:complete
MASGFKENFERGGGDDEMDYDDSAFYYFSMAMLSIVLIPATYNMIISPIFFGEMNVNKSLKNCKCKIC